MHSAERLQQGRCFSLWAPAIVWPVRRVVCDGGLGYKSFPAGLTANNHSLTGWLHSALSSTAEKYLLSPYYDPAVSAHLRTMGWGLDGWCFCLLLCKTCLETFTDRVSMTENIISHIPLQDILARLLVNFGLKPSCGLKPQCFPTYNHSYMAKNIKPTLLKYRMSYVLWFADCLAITTAQCNMFKCLSG